MQRVGLLLLGMVSLVAGGVIMDRVGRVGLHAMSGLGLQTTQGVRDAGNVLTRDELLRQKFILDILQQIYAPLQQQDLLMLDDRNIITNENLYMRPLTQEMQLVLDLINTNQMVSKQSVSNINNEYHMMQAVGFYRLLVGARDFDTFQRLVVYGRQNVNTEMFAYCLVLALGERPDTQMLIVPALHEIIPQLFVKDQIVDQLRHLDTGVSTLGPQIMDIMGMGKRNFFLNSRFAEQQQQQQEQQQGGLLGVLNRSQLWMPWRELHKQMALRKVIDGNVVQQDQVQTNKLVISLPGNGLLSQDISLKSHIGLFFDELLLNRDTVKNTNTNQFGADENILFGKRGQIKFGGFSGNRGINDYNTNSQYESIVGGGLYDAEQGNLNTDDRLLHVGRRFRGNRMDETDEINQQIYGGDIDVDVNRNREINAGRRFGLDIDIDDAMDRNRVKIGGRRFGNIVDENNSLWGGRRINKNRFDLNEERDMGRNIYMGRNNNVQESQRGVNTVSANDARLLFLGRRRQNPNTVVTMGSNRYDEDDFISGGRHVAKDDMNNERQKGKYNNYNDERRGNKYYNDNDDDVAADYLNKINNDRYINNDEEDINSYDEANDYLKRNFGGKGIDMAIGNNRDNFLNMITGGRMGQRKYMQNDQDFMYNHGWTNQYNGERLDEHLPTTNINDERLLHINRRKLNNFEQDRYINNNEGGIYEDVNDRYNTGYQRGNLNTQRTYLDDQTNWDTTRRGNQYGQSGIYDNDKTNYRNEKHGRRNRRSIVNQEQEQYMGQTTSINGRLVLHTLQQLVARLNIERIALGQPQLIENTQNNIGRGILSNNLVGNNAFTGVGEQTLNEIERIIQQIDNALQQKIGQITVASYNQKVNEIGLMLAGQIQGLGLTDILGDILQKTNQQQRKGLVANLLENQAAQILLAGIVKVVDQKVQQVFHQREQFISTVQGVNINDVEVDKLQTYLEQTNIDLSNLLDNNNNMDQTTMQGNGKVAIGRATRLNHKNFNVKIDVTSDRQQQVVVRNLLVPKIDGQNNVIPLRERRQNVIVLDITTVELQQGRNTLKLNSKDITITSRDTTPLTKIYQLVMQALNGDIVLQQNLLNGQSTLLPHHLLLPRGRTNGLPMQLITVITPLQGSSGIMDVQQGNPLNTLLLDNLPLNYPLHCDITDLDKVISMPNLLVKDVKIYHEENIQMPIVY